MTEFIRWNEPGLTPRGLLQDAPAPRSLAEVRADRRAKNPRTKDQSK